MAFKLTLQCPKHPRFNPVSGQEAVTGGCRACLKLIALHERYRRDKLDLEKNYGLGLREESEAQSRAAHALLALARTVVTKLREGDDLTEQEERVLGAL